MFCITFLLMLFCGVWQCWFASSVLVESVLVQLSMRGCSSCSQPPFLIVVSTATYISIMHVLFLYFIVTQFENPHISFLPRKFLRHSHTHAHTSDGHFGGSYLAPEPASHLRLRSRLRAGFEPTTAQKGSKAAQCSETIPFH